MYQRKQKRFINERVKQKTSRSMRLYCLIKYCVDVKPCTGHAMRYFVFDLSESPVKLTSDFDRDVRNTLADADVESEGSYIDYPSIPDHVIKNLKVLRRKYKGQ